MTVQNSSIFGNVVVFTGLSGDTKPSASSPTKPKHKDLFFEEDSKEWYIYSNEQWISMRMVPAGAAQEGSASRSDYVKTHEGWRWKTVTFSGAGDQNIYLGPCIIGRVISSAAVDLILKDNTTAQNTAMAIGAKAFSDGLRGSQCRTSGVLNASAAATVSVQVHPLNADESWLIP